METHDSDVVESLEIVMLYPDGPARQRVLSVLECIREKLTSAFQLKISGGKFNHLEDPLVRRCLAEVTAKADIVCIACRGHNALPETITRWLSQIRYSEGYRPLLAMVNLADPAGGAEVRDSNTFLQAFARKHEMDFLEYDMTELATAALPSQATTPASRHWARRYRGETSSLNE